MDRRRLARPLVPIVLMACLALLGGDTLAAEEPAGERILFPGSYALTPDGARLVFSWRGDLFSAPASGGEVRRLTSHPADESQPHVSPDGRQVAFVSTRSGSRQIWLMPLEGGAPVRLTSNTESASLEGWFPDGEAVLMRQARDHAWRDADRLFRRPVDPRKRSELLFDAEARDAAVSPDGLRIAFRREGVQSTRKGYRGSQAGQIWIYGLETGAFEKVTRGDHGERSPLWLPDGRHLLLVSEEDGASNLWRHDLEDGSRDAVTRFEDDGVRAPALSADGSVLVFRRLGATWRIALTTDVPPHEIDLHHRGDPTAERVLRRELKAADEATFTGDAREVAFVAGGDLWVMDTELREPRLVLSTPEEERDPVFAPDHQALYFVRDVDARPDIWVARRADPERHWWQNDAFELERLTDDPEPEFALSFTPDGDRLAFVRGRGRLFWMRPDGSDATELVSSWSPLQYAFSPDSRWLAYATADADYNRDVWLVPTDGSLPPLNVSRHPDDDGEPAFSPDGKLLAFTGRRWSEERDLCYVWLQEEDEDRSKRDRLVAKAVETMKGRKAKKKKGKPDAPTPEAAKATHPLAGIWQGTLQGDAVPAPGIALTLVLETGEDGKLGGTATVEDVFTTTLAGLAFEDGVFRTEIESPMGVVQVEGRVDGEAMRGTWRIEGTGEGVFELRREAASAAKEETKTPETEAKKPKKEEAAVEVHIDLDRIWERIRRIPIPDTSERGLVWLGDKAKLAFIATVKGERGLYTVTFPDALTPKRLTGTTGSGARWLPEAKKVGWLVGGTPATLDLGGRAKTFPFRLRQSVDLAERNAVAFDQAWRIIGASFYDPRLNDRDWPAIRAKYRPLARAALAPAELEYVIDSMLGELNGSHLNFSAKRSSWSPPGWREQTGHLGLRFDRSAGDDGLCVRDVVPDTPADRAGTRVQAGERLLAIDGVEVDADTNLARLLTGDPDRDVRLRVRAEDGTEREVVLRPTSYRDVRRRLYDRWLRDREALVETQGGGKLGYLHVRGMNWSSFQRFEEALFRVGHGRQGLVIDVRDNGGGFTTDHLLTSLTQPQHAFTVGRDGAPGYPQDRMVYARWTKPIVVLVNQNSFSNAEIFAHAIQNLDRGPIVGVPTAGGVLSTGGTTILDVGTLRLPFRGWFTLPGGQDMERAGCRPDHLIWPEPGDTTDRQLEKAVEVLLEEVAAFEARPRPAPAYAVEREAAK